MGGSTGVQDATGSMMKVMDSELKVVNDTRKIGKVHD